jgi:hypothetical protein
LDLGFGFFLVRLFFFGERCDDFIPPDDSFSSSFLTSAFFPRRKEAENPDLRVFAFGVFGTGGMCS